MKVYVFDQNNSSGYYYINEDVAQTVAIEAIDEDTARKIFDEIVEDYSDYCDCCGYRWHSSPYEVYDNVEEFLDCYPDQEQVRFYTVPAERFKLVNLGE